MPNQNIKRFADGDPLNVDALNFIYQNLQELLAAETARKSASGLDNATVKAYEPQMWAGATKRNLAIKPKSLSSVTIKYPGAKYPVGAVPRIVVTPVFEVDPPGDKTFFYKISSVGNTEAVIDFWSTNWETSSIGFDYHLVYMKPLS